VTAGIRLAIDSATDRVAVAVATPDGLIIEEFLEGARRHASALLGLIDRALERVKARPEAIRLVAVADGPGSFTGLRVGVAVAKAIAAAGPVPMYTAPSLLARASAIGTEGETVLALSSALRGELYAGVWRFEPGGRIVVCAAPRALDLAGIERLPRADRAVGDGPPDLLTTVSRRLGLAVAGPPGANPSAADLLRLIGRPGGAVAVADPAGWEPVYGRPAEAQAKWERQHGHALRDPGGRAG
jgi:tRNA threonylcarbamoyladenosine biosynthesis protein TsaB